MITQEILDAKWEEICDLYEEEDPYPYWRQWVNDQGGEFMSYQTHWGEGGITDFVDSLIEMLGEPERYEFFEDPTSVGTDWMGYVVFKKTDFTLDDSGVE